MNTLLIEENHSKICLERKTRNYSDRVVKKFSVKEKRKKLFKYPKQFDYFTSIIIQHIRI